MAQKKTSGSRRTTTKKTSGRKSTSNASEYVREEMHEQKKGGRKNPKQAIAIGLSRARRAGEDVPAPKKGTSAATKKKAQQDTKAGKRSGRKAGAKKTAGPKRGATKRKSSAKR